MADLKDYPLKATTDARSAMAERLASFVKELEFTLPRSGQVFHLKAVYDTWADFNQRAMSGGGALPAAAVLPDRPIYEPSSLTPRPIDRTWSGGDPTECDAHGRRLYPYGDGSGVGFLLYTHSEIVVPFVLVFRAKTKPQRKAIAKRLEEVFVEDGAVRPDVSLLNPAVPPVPEATAQPVRYGRLLEVPNYYNRKARFTLEAQQLLDAEASARENRWLGQFEIRGHMQVCVLRFARAMKPRVSVVVDGTTENRSTSGL